MNCGVRTVQRYEKDLRLPIRRLPGKNRGAVIAFPQELDAWLKYVPGRQANADPAPRTQQIVTAVHQSISTGAELRHESAALRSAHREAMMRLHDRMGTILNTIGSPKVANI